MPMLVSRAVALVAPLAYKATPTKNGEHEHVVNSVPCIQAHEIGRAERMGLERAHYHSDKWVEALRMAATISPDVKFVTCLNPDDRKTEARQLYALYVPPDIVLLMRQIPEPRDEEDVIVAAGKIAGLCNVDLDPSEALIAVRATATLNLWAAEDSPRPPPLPLTQGVPR